MTDQLVDKIHSATLECKEPIDQSINITVEINIRKIVEDPHEEIIAERTINNKGRILVAYSSTNRRLITFEILDGAKSINEITLSDFLEVLKIKLVPESVIIATKISTQNIIYVIEMEKGVLFDTADYDEYKRGKMGIHMVEIAEKPKKKENDSKKLLLPIQLTRHSTTPTITDKKSTKKEELKHLMHKNSDQDKKRKNNEKVNKHHVNKFQKTDSLDKNKKMASTNENISAGFDPDSSVKIAHYMSSNGIPRFTFYLTDYKSLEEGKWINDLFIDWYFQYLYDKVLSEDDRRNTFFYSALFFANLRDSTSKSSLQSSDRGYSQVRGFVRDDVNIFEKNFLIIPVKKDNRRWYLIIVCFPGLVRFDQISNASDSNDKNNTHNRQNKRSCIIMLNSWRNKKDDDTRTLMNYLSVEYSMKFGENLSFSQDIITHYYPSIPQHRNSLNSGVFILQFMENFFKEPIKDYFSDIKLSPKWLKPRMIIRKRAKLAHMLRKMSRETVGRSTPIDLPKLKFPSLRRIKKNEKYCFSCEELLFSD